jgi:uncharacterized protein
MTETKLFFKNSKNQNICGILNKSNKNTKHIVILVHGLASHKNRSSTKSLSLELFKKNISSFRIDLNGCGESEGEFANHTISNAVDDIISAINFMKSKHYEIFDLFGSSAGGLAVMATALKYSNLNKIALKAPVSDYFSKLIQKYSQETLNKWKKLGYIDYQVTPDFKLKLNYSFFEDIKKYTMYDQVNNIKCPVLIIHGIDDNVVEIQQSKKLVKNLSNGELIALPNADHSLEINGDRSNSLKLFVDFFQN